MRVSWTHWYVVVVVTPHLVLNLVAAQLGKAALLALLSAVTLTVAVAGRADGCCRAPAALGGGGLLAGALGLSFCCGPLVALVAALGLTSAVTRALWGAAVGILAVSLLLLGYRLAGHDPDPVRPPGGLVEPASPDRKGLHTVERI